MEKLKDRLLRDNQMLQITLKEFIGYFQQDLNDSAAILIAIEETKCIMKKRHIIEMNMSNAMVEIQKITTLSESIRSLKNHSLIFGSVP